MAFYTEAEARGAATRVTASSGLTASGSLSNAAKAGPGQATYDIFLCHSFSDAAIVLGAKRLLEEAGRSVYVDWVDDAQIDRSRVSAATAEVLRQRMQACRSLVYATSPSSPQSKWMPWELGYFDGSRGGLNVAIMPLVRGARDVFQGQEYLGLYPTIEKLFHGDQPTPYVTRSRGGTRQWLPLAELAAERKAFRTMP
jgi:hypothetical protein